jgi:hypothetical protein
MPVLPNSVRHWLTDSFPATLKSEIENLEAGTLPLNKCVSGGYVDDGHITITVLHAADDESKIQAKVGVFFGEIIAGCSCGDDPQTQSAYCELQVRIDKRTGEATFGLIPE